MALQVNVSECLRLDFIGESCRNDAKKESLLDGEARSRWTGQSWGLGGPKIGSSLCVLDGLWGHQDDSEYFRDERKDSFTSSTVIKHAYSLLSHGLLVSVTKMTSRWMGFVGLF